METRNVELVYRQAILGAELGSFDGIGFEFATGGGIVGIDLDHVVDPETGEVQPWALEIAQRMDSYTEYSPSGTDLHIFVQGDIPSSVRKKTLNKDTREAVEMYKEKRYFTITGSLFLTTHSRPPGRTGGRQTPTGCGSTKGNGIGSTRASQRNHNPLLEEESGRSKDNRKGEITK